MPITLVPIDQSNREACIALSVRDEQTGFVASNRRSLDWADSHPRCVPLGIHVGEELVGFVMYEPRGDGLYSIHRLMVDAEHQRRGIGRRAMQAVMDEIIGLGARTIDLGCRPGNTAARSLFEELGYVFHEEEPDGELVYRYDRPGNP